MAVYSTCRRCGTLMQVIDVLDPSPVHPCCDDGKPVSANSEPSLADSALWYASVMGWRVFPLHGYVDGSCTCELGEHCLTPGSHPRIDDWGHAASYSKRRVTEWWQRWPDSNIAGMQETFVAAHARNLDYIDLKPDRHGIIETPTFFIPLLSSKRTNRVPESWYVQLPPSRTPEGMFRWYVPPSPKLKRGVPHNV